MTWGRVAGAAAVAFALTLSVGVISADASGRPDAACIHEGLSPIPVTVRAGALYDGETGLPVLEVDWSGRPLARTCKARRTVEINFTLWFPHLRFFFTEGFPIDWLQFWNGRQVARGKRQRYVGPGYRPLECLTKARVRLRYEVIGADGAVFGKRFRSVPVKHLPCSK